MTGVSWNALPAVIMLLACAACVACSSAPPSFKKLWLQNLNDRRENACLKFAQKCIKNEKVKNMFPISVKLSKMIKRKSDKFKVKFARTKRYRQSAIPYMVNLLNINNSMKKNILKKTSQR